MVIRNLEVEGLQDVSPPPELLETCVNLQASRSEAVVAILTAHF